MNTIRQRLDKTWLINLAHYLRHAVVVSGATAALVLITDSDWKTSSWLLRIIAVTAGLALGFCIIMFAVTLLDLHLHNPDRCASCRRIRARITKHTRASWCITQIYHSGLTGIAGVTSIGLIIFAIITNQQWALIGFHMSIAFAFGMSALHLRYRHVCDYCLHEAE